MILVQFVRIFKRRGVWKKCSRFWAFRECTVSAQLMIEEVLLLQHRCCHVSLLQLQRLQPVRAPGWARAGRWAYGTCEVGVNTKRKHVDSQHSSPRPDAASLQLRLEEAPFPCWRSQPAGAPLFSQSSLLLCFSMLSSGTMEEFVTEEEEPWYDQQDLEQGKTSSSSLQHPHCQLLRKVVLSQKRLTFIWTDNFLLMQWHWCVK